MRSAVADTSDSGGPETRFSKRSEFAPIAASASASPTGTTTASTTARRIRSHVKLDSPLELRRGTGRRHAGLLRLLEETPYVRAEQVHFRRDVALAAEAASRVGLQAQDARILAEDSLGKRLEDETHEKRGQWKAEARHGHESRVKVGDRRER